ncbi:MAG: hypothetical protein K8T25_06090 [Planctomycetia bacterium]|nr:hypothetical protein [Planctomycetia bacterium]
MDSTGALPLAPDETTTTERVGTLRVPWDAMAVFGRRAPLEVEVGSGKGMFLARAAAERPDHDFLGIELANKYAHFAAARLARAGLTNARLLSGDALTFFRELPDAVSGVGLAAVHVYFPDPWWKKRHRKRRVMSAAFIGDINGGGRTSLPSLPGRGRGRVTRCQVYRSRGEVPQRNPTTAMNRHVIGLHPAARRRLIQHASFRRS